MGPATRRGPGPGRKTSKTRAEEKDGLKEVMQGERRRANARCHSDIWKEHRSTPSIKEASIAGRKKKTAEKKAVEETGEVNAFKVLQAEQKASTNKRKTKEPVEEKESSKRARTDAKKAGAAKKGGTRHTEAEAADLDSDKASDRASDKASDKASDGSGGAEAGIVTINRAPTLTLWVAMVAEREGYKVEEALTFGKYVSGVFAHSKGKSIGVIDSDPDREARSKERKREQRRGLDKVPVFGMEVTVKKSEDGQVRALESGGNAIEPKVVKAYLHRSFKDKLEAAEEAMRALAAAYSPEEIGKAAYHLYERFRPTVPPGKKGWGGKGELDLDLIAGKMVQEKSSKESG